MTAASWRSGTGDWKLVFEEQRAISTQVWAEPMVKLRLPHIFSLRRDPFERADFNSNVYFDWMIDHVPQLYQCSGDRGGPDRELREVPASPEGGFIQPRLGDGSRWHQRQAAYKQRRQQRQPLSGKEQPD